MSTAPAGIDQAQLLRQAFASFAEVSGSLEKAYEELRGKVRRLSSQLGDTNYYLESVLQSLPCGLIVVDSQNAVTTINRRAQELLGIAGLSLETHSAPSRRLSGSEDSSALSLPIRLQRLLEMIPDSDAAAPLFRADDPPREIALGRPQRTLSCLSSAMKRDERVLVLQDVSELRRLQEQMQKAERLAAMGEMALEVAHEIRNPLTGLSLFASLLRESDLSQADRDRYVDNIEIGIRSLDTTLTNMLNFSKEMVPRPQPAKICDLLEETVEFLHPITSERQIHVVREYGDDRLDMVDAGLLRHAFMNLVLNALQALPARGRLQLSTRQRSETTIVTISDDGPGLCPSQHSRVFEPHFATDRKGNGLGLSVAKRIVEAHGGEIRFESGADWGTRFTLAFPQGGYRS